MGPELLGYVWGVSPALPPVGLTATVSAGNVSLAWQPVGNTPSGYRLERSPDGLTWALLASPTAPAYQDTPGSGTFYYRVRAFNARGENSDPSTVAQVAV